MNGGDGKPEDIGSLPLSRDRLDHDTPPPPSQPGKIVGTFKNCLVAKIGRSKKIDFMRITSTKDFKGKIVAA